MKSTATAATKKTHKKEIESSFTLSRCLSSYVTSNLPNYSTTIVVLKKVFILQNRLLCEVKNLNESKSFFFSSLFKNVKVSRSFLKSSSTIVTPYTYIYLIFYYYYLLCVNIIITDNISFSTMINPFLFFECVFGTF